MPSNESARHAGAAGTDGVFWTGVYVFFTDFGLLSYGPDGNERWRLPLGPFNNPFGQGASPVLAGDRLLMICDAESGSFFVAVDKTSGRVLWRVERPDVTRGFSTPVLYQPKGGKINTDFIDNSAGVNTSDHEVNIKILLNAVERAGDITRKQRNELLAEMTDEVGRAAVVIDTGPWIFGRKVVIPAGALEQIDLNQRTVSVAMTKDQIKNAPEFDPNRGWPDEEHRAALESYYGRDMRAAS